MSLPFSEAPAPVPLGGVGTGGLELGPDGCFRNVSINNNRASSLRIPFAKKCFAAVRVKDAQGSAARILQTESAAPLDAAGISAPYVRAEQIVFDCLYPAATYGLRDGDFPCAVSWRAFSPVLPYDTEAATLPMAVYSVQVRNTGSDAAEVSVMFSWENLRGCAGDMRQRQAGGARVVVLDEREEPDSVSPEQIALQPRPALGLTWGLGLPVNQDTEGDYCLVAATRTEQSLSYALWDGESVEAWKALWSAFRGEGRMPGAPGEPARSTCGGLCLLEEVQPGDTAQFTFVLTWMCPRYTLDGVDVGNGYLARYRDSLEVAGYGLKHHRYFFRAIDDWQRRFSDTTLPAWFSRALLNSLADLSARTAVTKDGGFILADDVDDPTAATLREGVWHSLGVLLSFPAYAHTELGQYAGVTQGVETQGLLDGLIAPVDCGGEGLDAGAKLILAAARNFRMTGAVPKLVDVYPRLKAAATNAAAMDTRGEGLPDGAPGVAGLWACAWRAMVWLARQLKHEKDAAQYALIAEKADATYRAMCRTAAGGEADADLLPGPWYQRFLQLNGLGSGHDVSRLASRIAEGDTTGLRIWHAAALITCGEADKGMELTRRLCASCNPGPALWHVLYALQGVLYSIPDKTLYIAPNLPREVRHIDAPLVTPLTLGRLRYQVGEGEPYRQTIRLRFDSPVQLRHVELAVPKTVTSVRVELAFDDEPSHAGRELRRGESRNHVRLTPERLQLIQNSVSIRVTQSKPVEQ